RHLGTVCPATIGRLFGPESLPESQHAPDPRSDDLLVSLQAEGARPACFLVHPPGGIVVCYQALARHLDCEQPVYGIRSRGLHGESNLPLRLDDMAAEYVAAVRRQQP